MKMEELRQASKLTQSEVAEKLRVDRSAVAKWEAGAAKPRADKLPALAKLYNCSIEELLENDEKAV